MQVPLVECTVRARSTRNNYVVRADALVRAFSLHMTSVMFGFVV